MSSRANAKPCALPAGAPNLSPCCHHPDAREVTLLGFHVDAEFSNVIDGLIYADLCATDQRLIHVWGVKTRRLTTCFQPPDAFTLCENVQEGSVIRMGQPLMRLP